MITMNMKQLFGSENAYRMKTVKTMPCKGCGTVMHQGSGEFATDYQCPNCGREFNSGGQSLVSRSSRDDYEDGYEP
jgi:predicted RNA-binding Zn-ribbon protein involved in translation (DUF1610 family)